MIEFSANISFVKHGFDTFFAPDFVDGLLGFGGDVDCVREAAVYRGLVLGDRIVVAVEHDGIEQIAEDGFEDVKVWVTGG